MREKPTVPPRAALLLIFALTVTGCATQSMPTPPVVVSPPRIPSPPAVSAPPSSAELWTKHCKLMASAQRRLSISLPMSGPCSQPGQ